MPNLEEVDWSYTEILISFDNEKFLIQVTIMFPCFYNKAVLLAARLFNNFSMTVNANI